MYLFSTPEESPEEDKSDLLASIDTMSIEDLKASFQGVMTNVITQYGDNVEEAK